MKKASDVLARLLDENSQGKGRSYASVFRSWRDVAGLSLADHSRVYEIRHHNLFVEVDHNGWMQMLQLRKARILGNLRRKFGELEIRDIKVRINPNLDISPAGSPPDSSAPEASSGKGVSGRSGAVAASEAGTVAPAAGSAAGGADSRGGPAEQGGQDIEGVLAEVGDEALKQRLRKLFQSSLHHRRRP